MALQPGGGLPGGLGLLAEDGLEVRKQRLQVGLAEARVRELDLLYTP